jgi:predicted Zn-dependent protease
LIFALAALVFSSASLGETPTLLEHLSVSADETRLSLRLERRLGDRMARDLYRDQDYFDDPVLADYLQSVWQPLIETARRRSDITHELDTAFAWQLLQRKDRTINAFALPGGYVGINLGLIGSVTSKDELASVLAHELSHVTQRHISRLLSMQSEQSPWLLGAMIFGALATSRNPGGANAVIVGGQAVAAQSQLNFSRDMEREADRTGFGVAKQAGFAPQGFVNMFEKLQKSNRNNDTGDFPYLRRHPLTTERIADMRSRIPEGAAPAPESSLEHSMVSARARLLANASVDGLRNWYAEAEPATLAKQNNLQRVASLYGATLASLKLREFGKAGMYSTLLSAAVISDAAAQRQWRYLRAEIATAEGQPEVALQTLGFVLAPATRAELLAWVALKVATGRAGDAADAAQLWVANHPLDASMWQQLALARAAQGRTVAAVRAESEVNIAQLDYESAVTRLKAAQGLARNSAHAPDYIEASIVDVRLRQVEQLLREQAVER